MTPLGLFTNILCPIDFSPHSRHALSYAALLAARSQGKLVVVFIDDPLLAAAALGTKAEAAASADLQRFVGRVVAPYSIAPDGLTVAMGVGRPGREIKRMADRLGSDLIVMGAHGLTGLSRMMLGSTTEQILRTTSVPVLAIPPTPNRQSRGLLSRWPERCAMVPVDLGASSRRAATVAAEVAAGLGAPVCLVHMAPHRARQRLTEVRDRLTRLEHAIGPHALSSRLLVGAPAEQIAAAAADSAADLVILTRRRGRGLFGKHIGVISYQVLCDAQTPVLALPSTDAWLRRARKKSRRT